MENIHRIHNDDCKYYDSDDFSTQCNANKVNFSLFHMNIRRIAKHKGELQALLSTLNHSFDVIVLTEVGDDADNYINNTFISGYSSFTHVPNFSKYGGVAVMVKNDLGPVTLRSDLKLEKCCNCHKCETEDVWIQMSSGDQNYIIGGIYRHPNGNACHFSSALEKSLEKLPDDINCIISGDININLLNYENQQPLNYLTIMTSFNFAPYITIPTRITDDKATLIDHIFMKTANNHPEYNTISGNLFTDITDHLPNFILLSFNKPSAVKNRPFIRIYSERNTNSFKATLQNTNWQELLQEGDVDEMYSKFYSYFYQIFDSNFPLVKQSRRRAKDKKWITPALKNSIRHKNNLYKIQLRKPTSQNIERYKKYKNTLTTCLKQAETDYYHQLFQDRQNYITKFWKEFSHTLNSKKRQNKSHLHKLIINNNSITKNSEISNAMNNYFCTIGKNITDSLPNTTGHFSDYLVNKIQQTFFLAPVTNQEVYKELIHLKNNKSPGPDDFTPKLIKSVATYLHLPLTILYNKSIETATFPNDLKIAKVIPLFKKNCRYKPENYRPISLLNCFGKIMERLVYNQMIKFIEKHNILYKHQYGFRKKYSTTLALINIVDKVKQTLDDGMYSIGIFLDIKKAFDSICHEILLKKLDHYGFRGHVNSFLKSYLSNRQQFTEINNTRSETEAINCGVPQGSILGPLLFLLFVNDIQYVLQDTDLRLFADDTSIFLYGKNPITLISSAEQKMAKIEKWYILNKMALSLGKSNFIYFMGLAKTSVMTYNR